MAGTINAWNNQIAAASTAITLNSGTNTISISTDASATTVNIGTGAAVKGVTIGSTTSTSALTLNSGSSGIIATGIAGTSVANKNYVTINTSTGALGSDSGFSATGALILLQTLTASSSASLAFTSTYITGTYPIYMIQFNQFKPATNGATLNMNWSTDNGSTYLAASFQTGANAFGYNSATWTNTNSTSTAPICPGSSSVVGVNGALYIFGLAAAVSGAPSYVGQLQSISNIVFCAGNNTGSPNVNNVKFSFSAGNIASGTVSLYGITQ